MFAANPSKYAPQYGGYCTLGVGLDGARLPLLIVEADQFMHQALSMDPAERMIGPDAGAVRAENIDPERAWRIIDDKLYFVYDPTYVEELDGPARDDWLASAEKNWPSLKTEIEQERFN